MLVLTVRLGKDEITLGEDIHLQFKKYTGKNQIRIYIEAPKEIKVKRKRLTKGETDVSET